MGAILILKEMPKNCFFCPLRGEREWFGSICVPYENLHRTQLCRHLDMNVDSENRPEWCPLMEKENGRSE